ncbi:enoyl-CoA hydratase/isomerase family protein [Actibacterium lipolyticum]|uniref:4-chlorobenzoyl coenzyme A dehalogenase-2 n=1 Tax=Actibacterium lipolyticum TaxID=1524263 RepID=A0A238KU49_9RHOB|nr:enoyl-CoA hydratase/isomerase family protein [Actibacterium lipolyticum]SMX46363.1 4-chlorobenzoyl coenzyme A dehalogenase-2 [Actibacterium lipolyticum]
MIALEKGDARWTVTINRPDKANSLTKEMLRELEVIFAEAGRADVAALVLTGEGKVFSAGADLDEAKAGLATDGVWERLSTRLANLNCLTLCALNGTLAGGAFGMALACDMRIAVPSAKFFYPVMKLGFLPQPSDPGRLVALVGPARAKMILMGGAKLTAEEAYAFGLIERIVAKDELPGAIDALCADAEAAAPKIRVSIKDMCNGKPV